MVGENVGLVCRNRSAIASVTKDFAIFKEFDGKRAVGIKTLVRTLEGTAWTSVRKSVIERGCI